MGILDGLLGARKNFFLRDFRNASHLRPDVNPPRQKFQAYVNFILNRDLYSFLYGENGTKEFRTRISSLVRTADLPSVTFQTETKNSYNRKKIVNTGVQYNPVSMTVFDTVGNEWLLTLMKYFSYHYMDPRNKQEVGNRDIEGSVVKQGGMYTKGSSFGLQSESTPAMWDSNLAGYNPNITAHFFERIDYVLYHGNKGVQYSIINPVLTEFKPGNIDYSDSGVMEFNLSFEYERFTVFNQTNFGLSEEDVDRFEDTSMITGPAFGEADLPIGMQEREMVILGNTTLNPEARGRSANPEATAPATPVEEGDNSSGEQVDENGDAVQNNEQQTPPPTEQPDAEAVEQNTASSQNEAGDVTTNTSALPSTYGSAATFSPESGAEDSFFGSLLEDVADAGLAAVFRGGSVKDAVLGTAVRGITTQLGQVVRDSIDSSSPNQGLTDEQINGGS